MTLRPWLRPGRLLLLTALLLAVLAAGHAVLWNTMASRLQAGFDIWAAARRASGWRVEHAPPVRGGWPFAATLRLPEFRLSGGTATLPGGIEWSSAEVVLAVRLPRLDELQIRSGGPQRLRLGNLDLPFRADRLEGSVPLQADVLPKGGSFGARRLRIGTPAGGVEIAELDLTLDTRASAIEGEPALTVQGEVRDVLLPTAGSLGRAIAHLALDASLTGPVPGGRSPATRAATWRDAGGTVEIRRLDATWGPATARGTATVALDEALQPMGAGTLRLTGANAVLDSLVAAGLVPARSAGLARGVIGLLSRPAEGGGPPQIEVPLTLEDRSLTVARIPVARLPPVAWPAGGERVGPGF
ncbi:DUF2125 domain-containing protein [Roseomonas sp. CCTCC AB2023176]|uniref:DUF2125 domain-containing protein n=1 Tax=Roseomonas sp. CCTCC AB2023176 TaxID=3342640 RepID=UPI0035DD4EC6